MSKQQFLDLEGLNVLVSEIAKKIEQEKVISYENIFAFPTVGKENTLYISEEDNTVYRWDDNNVKYYNVGFNPENIQLINGGNSTKTI